MGGDQVSVAADASKAPPIPPIPPPSPDRVAVVVLTFDGHAHLEAGLPAMLALDGLAGPAAVVVADNGSTDGTVDWLRSAHPGVTVIELGRNLGFAAGYDRALERIDADWTLLLNNDTRPAPDVLRRLCDAIWAAGAHRVDGALAGPVACAGARLVDWDARNLDFDGGGMSLTGHGHALGHGSPLSSGRDGDALGLGSSMSSDPERHALGHGSPITRGHDSDALVRPTLFCSGAAMLVHRATFVDLDGFDPEYFAYYEDVDFGWRLWAAGYRALHVPAAVVRHRGGGSAAALGDGPRARLHERNAIMTVVKNADLGLAPGWIRAALGLAAWRAAPGEVGLRVIDGAAARASTRGFDLNASGGIDGGDSIADALAESRDSSLFPPPDWSGWRHLEPLSLDLEALGAARRLVQARRRRPDAELIGLMRMPWAPVPPTVAGWAALVRADRVFGLQSSFGRFGGSRRGGPRAIAGRVIERLAHWTALGSRMGRPAPESAIRRERPAIFGDPVDVIIVTYEGRALLEDCLPALVAQDYPAVRFIVADNGSRDGTVAWLREAWPDVEVLDLGVNLGFAEANNRAIAASEAPWVALVNSDTLPDAGWLSALVRAADGRPEVGAVASRMLFMDRPEIVQSAGIAVDPSGIAWDRLGGAPAEAGAVPAVVFGASAGAALYRRAALEDVAEGGVIFDPRYFMYLEDVDLAWRLRLRGWDAVYAPEATILHQGSATSGEGSAFKNRLLARNKVWTVTKSYPARGLARYGPLILAYDLASVPYRVVFSGQGAALRGRIEALAGLRRVLGQRRRIQARRRADWPEIQAAMEPIASPLGVMRRYRHLRRSDGVVEGRE